MTTALSAVITVAVVGPKLTAANRAAQMKA